MIITLRRFAGILLIGILLHSCKKDRPVPAVNLNNSIETQPHLLKPVTEKVNEAIGGYYVGLPFSYQQTTKKYPLIVFIPGAGQYGNGALDIPLLLNDGIAQLMDEKKFPPNFTVDGKNFSFIVLTPQFKRQPSPQEVVSFIDLAKKKFRVDIARIYLSGLSVGGFVTTEAAAEYASLFAAIVPIAGSLFNTNVNAKCAKIASHNLPVWAFHNVDDPSINSEGSKLFVSLIQQFNPTVIPKITLFPVYGHDAWTKALNPAYKENDKNVYEWMLQYSR